MTGQAGFQDGPASPYVAKLASALSDFNNSLASNRSGSLAQIWLPEPGEDGGVVLNTQGLPYSINGVGDLLALFRCISCKYKFSTDVTKPQQMGAVGRVFTSGEPEMSNHVQRYDQHVYLRAAEAQRCRVHSTLFMPLYAGAARDACLGVFEVVLTDPDVNFAGMVGWIISCLQSQGLFTAEVDTGSLADQRLGLRQLGGHDDGVSALESGIAPRHGGGSAEEANGVAGSTMLLPLKREAPGGEAEAARQQQGGTLQRLDGGSAGDAGKLNPVLQRLASGPAGLPSPAPQQQQMAPGSGSGGASGPLPAPPPTVLPGLQQGMGLQQGGGHRLSGSLDGLPALMGSGGSLPNGLPGLQSGPHSGSGGLPSASTAQQQQQLAAGAGGADPQSVAAMVTQLLQQHSGIAGGLAGAPQQLAALLSAHTAQQPSPAGLSLGASPAVNGGLGASPGVNGLAAMAAAAQAQQAQQAPSLPQPPALGGDAAAQQAAAQAQQQQQQQQQQQDDDMEDETDEEDKPFLRPAPGAAQKYGQGNRILTYDDLAAQFGYGLKEAAARLNICPTTLKRACRRLGVPRWPRREIVKHKKRKQSVKGEGSQQANGGAAQLNGATSLPIGGAVKGFSSGSGPSSGATAGGNLPLPLLGQATAGSLPRPASSSLLNGLQGLDQLQLPIPAAAGPAAGGLPPELAAALASTLQQQQQQQQQSPAIVSQVLTLLQQAQQQPLPGLQQQQQQQQQQQPGGGLLNGVQQLAGMPGPLPPLAPAPAGGAQLPPRSSPLPPAPLLSNLGLPRKADSKLNQSVGQGMGSLDILAAADFEMSVGNMSVGNSPRIALSNLGGLSNLGLSAFDFTGAVAGGNGPAATATGGAGGATGPQNGPAVSSGAVSRPPADKS